MKYFYFARHGETYWNKENKICGCTDIALTPRGHAQAEELAEQVKENCPDITVILYSPLTRARETAEHIAFRTGIPMFCEERLREQNFGKYEGTPGTGKNFMKPRRTLSVRMKAAKAC